MKSHRATQPFILMDSIEEQGESNTESSEAASKAAPAPVVGPGKAIPRFAIVLANSKGKEVVRRYHTLADAQDAVYSQKAHDAFLALDNLQRGARNGGQNWLSAHAVDVPIRFRILQQPSRVRDSINMLKTRDSDNFFHDRVDGGEPVLDSERVRFRMIMLESIQRCEYTFWPIESDGHWIPVVLHMKETVQGSQYFDRVACIFVADPDGDSSRQLAVTRRIMSLLGAYGFPAERFSLPVYVWTPQQVGDCNCGLQCYVIFDEFMRRMTRQFLSNQETDPYEPIRRHFDAQSVREEMAGLCAAMCVRELGSEARIAVEVVGEVEPPDTIPEEEVCLEDLERGSSATNNSAPETLSTNSSEPSVLVIKVLGPEDFAGSNVSSEDDDRFGPTDSSSEGSDDWEESDAMAYDTHVFSSKSDEPPWKSVAGPSKAANTGISFDAAAVAPRAANTGFISDAIAFRVAIINSKLAGPPMTEPPRQSSAAPSTAVSRAVNTENISGAIAYRIALINSKMAKPPTAKPFNTEPLRVKQFRPPDSSYSYLKYAIYNSMKYKQQNLQSTNTKPHSAVPSRIVSAMARLVTDGLAMAEPATVLPVQANPKELVPVKALPLTAVPGRYFAFTPFRDIPSNVGSASECLRLAVHNSTYLGVRKAQNSDTQPPNDQLLDAQYWFHEPWWVWTTDVGSPSNSQLPKAVSSRAATTEAAEARVPRTGLASERAIKARRLGSSKLGRFNASLSDDETSNLSGNMNGAAVDTAQNCQENMLAIRNGLKRKSDSTASTKGKRPKVTYSDLSPEADGNSLPGETI